VGPGHALQRQGACLLGQVTARFGWEQGPVGWARALLSACPTLAALPAGCGARAVGRCRESAAAAATGAIAAPAPRNTARNRCPGGRRTGIAPGATSSAAK
jgi:hypothetical protein